MIDDRGPAMPPLSQSASSSSARRPTRAGTPADGRLLRFPERGVRPRPASADELEQLRNRVKQQDHTIARLSDALIALRNGGLALRDENNELRRELQTVRRALAVADHPAPAVLSS